MAGALPLADGRIPCRAQASGSVFRRSWPQAGSALPRNYRTRSRTTQAREASSVHSLALSIWSATAWGVGSSLIGGDGTTQPAEEAAPVAGLAVPGSDRLRLCRLYPGLLGGDADLSDPRYLEAWPKARRCTISRPPPISRRRARWLAPWTRALPTASMLSASDAASNALVRAGLIE